jgi:hypothetical protein
MPGKGLYIEVAIHAPMDEVWRLTQEPAVHERWDLRFSTIRYLPRANGEPQRFLYETRIGFGLRIAGEGESTGTFDSKTERTSALRFSSDSKLSLIRSGSGYWKYIETATGVRFFTWYDYAVRFGFAGRLLDKAFRPLIGWATAWSFDRLRLWAEIGQPPEVTRRATLIYAICRAAVCFVWIWHGAVPKLLLHRPEELQMLLASHTPAVALPWIGAGEVVLGLAGLVFWRRPHFLSLSAVLMVAALAAVIATSPSALGGAFNPVTLNVSVIALSVAAYLAYPQAAFAARCQRKPKGRD